MHPYIDFGVLRLPFIGEIHLGLPTYGLFVATALVVGWFWMLRNARRDGIDPERAAAATFWALVAGILGGKLGLLIVEGRSFLSDPGQVLTLEFLRAAGLVWTAVLAGLAAMAVSARRLGLPAAKLFDAAAVPVPVCQAIGRIGCLLAGCCYGGACSAPWAVTYTSTVASERTGVPLHHRLHPSPVYEALWCVAVVLPALLLLRRSKRRAPGEIALAYFVLYGAGRFLVEFTRGDRVRGLWFGDRLSTSQVIALVVAPLAGLFWIRLRRQARGART